MRNPLFQMRMAICVQKFIHPAMDIKQLFLAGGAVNLCCLGSCRRVSVQLACLLYIANDLQQHLVPCAATLVISTR